MPDYADPTIALRVNPSLIYGAGGGNQLNPLEAIKTFADVQRTNLMNQQLQMELNAKQAAGEVLSASPDLSTGLDIMSRSNLAPYIPQVIEGLQAARLSMASTSQKQLEMSDSGLDSGIKSLMMQPDGALDPQLWETTKRLALDRQSDPQARAMVSKSFDDLWTAQQGSNPQEIQNRRLAILLPHLTPEQFQMYSRTRVIEPGMATIGMTPQSGGVGGAAAPVGSGPGAGAGGTGMSPAASAPASTVAPTAGVGSDVIGRPEPPPSAGGDTGQRLNGGVPSAGNPYQPLTNVQMGTGGIPMKGDPNQEMIMTAQKEYDKDTEHYSASARGLGQLTFMENYYNNMIKDGLFLQPGPGAEIRTRAAAVWNQAIRMMGIPNPEKYMINTTQIGSAEEFMKQTSNIGIQALQTMGGMSGHTASQFIQRYISTMPGTNNTYAGGIMLLEGVRQQIARQMDMHDYQTMWKNNPAIWQGRPGNFAYSANAFDHDYPASGYSIRSMNALGMNSNMTPQDMIRIGKQYHMTPEQVTAILRTQFDDNQKFIARGPTGELPAEEPPAPER